MTILRTCLWLIVATGLCCGASARAQTRDVVGTVRDSQTGQPLAGVTVMILQTGDSTTTDATGRYSFSAVPEGLYTFIVGETDYEPRTLTQVSIGASCCIGATGNVNNDPGNVVDISDLTALVNYLFVTFQPLVCPPAANIDGDSGGIVDISDLTRLVNHLFVTFAPTAPCQ